MRFEALDLLDVKRLEITKSGISLEAIHAFAMLSMDASLRPFASFR